MQVSKAVLSRAVTVVAAVAVLGAVAGCSGGSTPPPAPSPPVPGPSQLTGASPAPSSTPRTATTVGPVPSNPPIPAGTAGSPRGQVVGAVDGQSPDGVAGAFAAATFTYDTALDRSPFDAQVRSAVYATPAFAAVLKQPLQQGGGAQWNTLAAHHGFTTVALTANHDDGRPPDQLGSAARSYTVDTTGHGDNGWVAPLDSQTMYVFMTRTGTATPWQVARVSFSGGS